MPDQFANSAQGKTVDLDRGVFVIRYASAEDDAFPPKVKIDIPPGDHDSISPILHPDEREPVLWQPGTGLVVQARDPGQLRIEVTPTRVNGSAVATVKIEALTQGQPALEITTTTNRVPRERAAPAEQGASGLRIMGHMAGRGDVFVNANEWIGGPSAPSRIEGIAIAWDGKPSDVTLQYAVKTARSRGGSEPLVGPDTFTGTRGQALPVVGIVLELAGPAASGYDLAVDAVFLGAPTRSAKGQRIALSGPTGGEPLVGLRLGFERVAEVAHAEPTPAPKAQKPGRVRVFRSTGANPS